MAGLLGVGGAHAAVATQEFRFNLRYSPAELASADGAERLYRRIQYAAHRACGVYPGADLKQYFLAQKCFERAVESAVAKVDQPALTAIHHNRSPRTAAG